MSDEHGCVFMICFKVLLVGAMTFYAVSKGRVAKETLLSRGLLSVPVIACGLSFVAQNYNLILPGNAVLGGLAMLLFNVAVVLFFAVQVLWYWVLWKHYQTHKTLGNEEQKESVYMLAMLFYLVACMIVTVIFDWPHSWLDTGDQILIGYIVVQILCILLATVLPTMLMRQVAQVQRCLFCGSFALLFLSPYLSMSELAE